MEFLQPARYTARQRGFTLIEALIALFVFSIALLGIAALLARAVGVSHSAYLRSTASIQAMDMAERIRANITADHTALPKPYELNCLTPPAVSSSLCVNNACTASQLADWDNAVWCKATADRFGGLFSRAKVTSVTGGYEIFLEWKERVVQDDSKQTIETRSFTWRVSQ